MKISRRNFWILNAAVSLSTKTPRKVPLELCPKESLLPEGKTQLKTSWTRWALLKVRQERTCHLLVTKEETRVHPPSNCYASVVCSGLNPAFTFLLRASWNSVGPWEPLNKRPFANNHPDPFPSGFWGFCPFSVLPPSSVDSTDSGFDVSSNAAYQPLSFSLSLFLFWKQSLYQPALWNNRASRQGPEHTCLSHVRPRGRLGRRKDRNDRDSAWRLHSRGSPTKWKKTFFFKFFFLFFFLSAGNQNKMQLEKWEQRVPRPSVGLASRHPQPPTHCTCAPAAPGAGRPASEDPHSLPSRRPLLHRVPLPKTRRSHLLKTSSQVEQGVSFKYSHLNVSHPSNVPRKMFNYQRAWDIWAVIGSMEDL